MNVGFNYQADEKNVVSAFSVLEAGPYRARITKCTFGPTSDNIGKQFTFVYTIVEGENAGRTITDNVFWTWDTDHDKAVNFGHKKFNSILIAINHPHFSGETDELLGSEMVIDVTVQEYDKNDGTKGTRNNISGYNACETSSIPNTVVNSIPQTPSAPKGPVLGGGVPINPFFGRK